MRTGLTDLQMDRKTADLKFDNFGTIGGDFDQHCPHYPWPTMHEVLSISNPLQGGKLEQCN